MDPVSLNQLSCNIVDKIFGSFMLLCRGFDALYADTNRLKAEKTQWFMHFTKNGIIAISQVQRGMDRLSLHRHPNPPQLGEFLDWCNPSGEELGIPDVRVAYKQAVSNSYPGSDKRWDHPAVYTAWRQTGSENLSKLPSAQSYPMFERNYEIIKRRLIAGDPVEDIPLGIVAETPVRRTSEIAERELENMRAILGLKKTVETI